MLEQRFDTASEHYEALRESCESSVARWVWATAPRYDLDPLLFFDRELSVGRVVRLPPEDPRGCVAYGFSNENRIVAERQYVTDLHGRYYRTFYCEADDRILSYHFHHDLARGCINCKQLVFSGRHPAYYQKWAVRGWTSCTYVTVDGWIRSFTEVFKQDDEPEQQLSGKLRYGEDGRIEVWTKWPGTRQPELTFRGTPPAENPFLRAERDSPKRPH